MQLRLEGGKDHHRVVAAKAEAVGDARGDVVLLLHVGHHVKARNLLNGVLLHTRDGGSVATVQASVQRADAAVQTLCG